MKEKKKKKTFMIKDPPLTLLYIGKHAVYFEFSKRLIDTPFVKTARGISF